MLRLFKQYYPIRNIFFVVIEGLFIYASVILSSWLLQDQQGFLLDKWAGIRALFITLVCQASLYYNDLYDLRASESVFGLSTRLTQALGFSAIFLAVAYFVFPNLIIGSGTFAVSITMMVVLVVSWRFCYMAIINRGLFNQRIVLLGNSDLARNIVKEISSKPDCGYTISPIRTDSSQDGNGSFAGLSCIYEADYNQMCDIAKAENITKIVVALKERRGQFPTRQLLKCRIEGIEVIDGNSFYEMLTGKLLVEQINPGWLIFSDGFQKSIPRKIFKRFLDIAISLVMLILLSPLLVVVTVLIKLDSKGPVFFAQERVGERRKSYRVYKFRSMVTDAEELSGPVWAGENDPRITRVGKIVRKLRIDELPQIWNVLKGEMSFVGPRPEREFFVNQLEKAIPYYGERFSVKPGITGWAQISYGYGATVEDAVEKLNYDLFYIKNMSLFMDLMIILRTVKTVLFGKGAR